MVEFVKVFDGLLYSEGFVIIDIYGMYGDCI